MVGITLSQIKKYSNADYFLAIALKPLDTKKWNAHKSKKMTAVLLTIIYNRDGKKVYSKIYAETIEPISYPTSRFSKSSHFYDCIVKLLENQGEQISNDLSFLLTADDAPAPTLEDLHKRLQQPGTLDDDVKYLERFNQKY
jgi:hypothetical protein